MLLSEIASSNGSFEDELSLELLNVKKGRFSNDPRITKRIKIGKPIFKREVRNPVARAGYHELLEKIGQSDY